MAYGSIMRVLFFFFPMLCLIGSAGAIAQEEDFQIVKYGMVKVNSADATAQVLIDEVPRGRTNTVIEKVIVGERAISCTSGDKTVSGTFSVRKNETLMLEARFDAGVLADLSGRPDVQKKKEDAGRRAEPKQQASPKQDPRELHLHVFKAMFRNLDDPNVTITFKTNPGTVGDISESRGNVGKYYRTKQGLLLCDTAPCQQEWTGKFYYRDEKGGQDAFLLGWKQMVFSGMTPAGTSSRELTWCLNGTCDKLEDTDKDKKPHSSELGRYTVTWTKAALVIQRTDILRQIKKEGGKVPNW